MKTALILLSFTLSFFFSNEEKVLVLKNVNVVDTQSKAIAYRYNIFIKDKKIWKIRPSKQTDKHLIAFPSIDMTGKYLLPTAILQESDHLNLKKMQESLISDSVKCNDAVSACPSLTEGREASFLVLLANPLNQSINSQQIEGFFSRGNWHTNP